MYWLSLGLTELIETEVMWGRTAKLETEEEVEGQSETGKEEGVEDIVDKRE